MGLPVSKTEAQCHVHEHGGIRALMLRSVDDQPILP